MPNLVYLYKKMRVNVGGKFTKTWLKKKKEKEKEK